MSLKNCLSVVSVLNILDINYGRNENECRGRGRGIFVPRGSIVIVWTTLNITRMFHCA